MQIKVIITVPKQLFDDKAMVAEIERIERNKTAPEVKKIFKNTTNGWEHDVDFGSTQKTTSNSIGVSIYPQGSNGKLYALVSHGAKKHLIHPTNAGMLRFQPGYSAATTPHMLKSGPKQRFGEYWVANEVKHPGFEGREFNKVIGAFYGYRFAHDVQHAIDMVAKRAASPSNHETLS